VNSRGLGRKILHTFATLVFGQGASIAAGIATAHAFGPAGKGSIAFAGVLLTFAVTTADGLKSAIAYQIGTERRDPHAVWRTSLRAMAVLGPVGTAIFLLLYLRAPGQPAYLYTAFAFPFSMYVQAIGIVYILKDRVERINVQNALTIGGGYSLAILALVLAFHVSVAVVLGVWVAGYAAAALWNTFGLANLLGPAGALAPVPGLAREQIAFASKSALSATVTFLALRIDVFIVSALLAPAALGIYTLATLEFADSAALVARIVRSLVAVQLAVGIALFIAGPWLIAHVYGGRFAESGALLRILLPGLVLYSADGMLSYFIGVRAGRPVLLLALETVTLVVCGACTLAAVPRYGLAGAALADTIAYVLSFAVKIFFFNRIGGIPFGRILVARPSDVPAGVALRLRRIFPAFVAR
jgi:O-antigen/teichoic acid export membrane protein